MAFTDFRRTKIVATVGPTSEQEDVLSELVVNGANVFRLNFSHGTHDEHLKRIETIRKVSDKLGQKVAILADLQGPKIRCGKVQEGGILLINGEQLTITTDDVLGAGSRVSTGYKSMPTEVKPNDRILLDDGLLELKVLRIEDEKEIITEVVCGGILTSNKGINLPHVELKTPALTEKDEEDLVFILKQDVDFVALSFVRRASDLQYVYDIMDTEGRHLPVISKIEKPEALECIDEIIEASYGLMVARGDLGVEIAQERVPLEQKSMIKKCNRLGKPVIVATQMMDSMIRNPRPTRAEISDIANAVLDGASAVMLSGETASGKFPVLAVKTMGEVCQATENEIICKEDYVEPKLDFEFGTDAEGLCYGAVRLAARKKAKMILSITETGRTAKELSRFRPTQPIFAVICKSAPARNELCLHWGVQMIEMDTFELTDQFFGKIEKMIENHPSIEEDDLVVITAGVPFLHKTPTNMVKIHRVKKGEKAFL